MNENIIRDIENCTTEKQVLNLLRRHNVSILRNDTEDAGYVTIWVDELTRIYQPHKSRTMKVQRFQKVKMEYSGIPVFFG